MKPKERTVCAMLLPATVNGEVQRCYQRGVLLRSRSSRAVSARCIFARHKRGGRTRRSAGMVVRNRDLVPQESSQGKIAMKIQGKPPDRPGCPGRGSDLPSDLSQGEKHRVSNRDLPSNYSLGTTCPVSDRVGTAPNSSSLGAAGLVGRVAAQGSFSAVGLRRAAS
jgi:hypothetical protein